MANISIKDVPDAWAEALRQRAMRNHRSLQGELMSLIERAVSDSSPVPGRSAAAALPGVAAFNPVPAGPVVGVDRLGRPITRRGVKTIEQIYAEHLARHPKPIEQGPMSVDIIRHDRDNR